MRNVAVKETIAELEVSVCRSDISFLVLAEPGLDTRAPLRREPVKIAEAIQVSGWGYTSDSREALPENRSTLDSVFVTDIGPGRIPLGTFAVAGNSVCLGDSGSVALIDGAVVGTYSRIEAPQICSLPEGQNVFTGIWNQTDLITRAYKAIGEEPWYAGDRPPWLAPANAACTKDDDCRSARCEPSTSTCALPCGGPTKVACAAGLVCNASNATCETPPPAPAPAAAPSSDDGCNVARGGREGDAMVFALSTLAFLFCRRKKSGRVSTTPCRSPRSTRG